MSSHPVPEGPHLLPSCVRYRSRHVRCRTCRVRCAGRIAFDRRPCRCRSSHAWCRSSFVRRRAGVVSHPVPVGSRPVSVGSRPVPVGSRPMPVGSRPVPVELEDATEGLLELLIGERVAERVDGTVEVAQPVRDVVEDTVNAFGTEAHDHRQHVPRGPADTEGSYQQNATIQSMLIIQSSYVCLSNNSIVRLILLLAGV